MAKHIPFAKAVNQSESWAFKFLRELKAKYDFINLFNCHGFYF